VNPYGVAVVWEESGDPHQGHVLVSNFNNSMNLQGTERPSSRFLPAMDATKLFAQIDATKLPGSRPGCVGWTTALVALSRRE
jgi:hypothetical protein